MARPFTCGCGFSGAVDDAFPYPAIQCPHCNRPIALPPAGAPSPHPAPGATPHPGAHRGPSPYPQGPGPSPAASYGYPAGHYRPGPPPTGPAGPPGWPPPWSAPGRPDVGPVTAPGRAWPILGGIFSIVTSLVYLALGILAILILNRLGGEQFGNFVQVPAFAEAYGYGENFFQTLTIIFIAWAAVAAISCLFGILACGARLTGVIGSGILQILWAALMALSIKSTMDRGNSVVLPIVFLSLSALAAILCFIGIAQAGHWRDFRRRR